MHHIYHTEGIILSSRPSGESGKYLTVLSKEFGLIKLEAQATRSNYSKLKFATQDFSVANLSFVRGKSGNRLISALFLFNLFYQIEKEEILKILAKVFKLIEKMIIDEESVNNIYDLILFLGNFLKINKNQKKTFFKNIEIIVIYRILADLGYLAKEGELKFLIDENIDQELFKKVKDYGHNKIVNLINLAISESHL
jgi:recombinational DNA repair protein (RecF pathway)